VGSTPTLRKTTYVLKGTYAVMVPRRISSPYTRMPYTMRKVPNKKCYRVVNTKTGKVKARCSTKKNATKQLRLLRALENNPTFRKTFRKGGAFTDDCLEYYKNNKDLDTSGQAECEAQREAKEKELTEERKNGFPKYRKSIQEALQKEGFKTSPQELDHIANEELKGMFFSSERGHSGVFEKIRNGTMTQDRDNIITIRDYTISKKSDGKMEEVTVYPTEELTFRSPREILSYPEKHKESNTITEIPKGLVAKRVGNLERDSHVELNE